jgi:hypothetical protein
MLSLKSKRQFTGPIIPDHTISKFFGINTELSDIKTMADGWTPDALNWLTGTEQDCIILRRGTALLGKTRNLGTDGVTGLGVGTLPNGTQVLFLKWPKNQILRSRHR